jgi:hypothetical protein
MTMCVALRRDVQGPSLFENETSSLDFTSRRRMRSASDVELIVVDLVTYIFDYYCVIFVQSL